MIMNETTKMVTHSTSVSDLKIPSKFFLTKFFERGKGTRRKGDGKIGRHKNSTK